MERLAVNVLVAFALCVLAVTLVLMARPLVGYRTRVTNVWWTWWTRVPYCSPTYLKRIAKGPTPLQSTLKAVSCQLLVFG